MQYCGNEMADWQRGVNQAFGQMYFAIYSIDLKCGCYLEISTLDMFREYIPARGESSLLFDMVIRHYVSEGYQESMQEFLDMDTLSVRLTQQNAVSNEFFGTTQGWCRASLVAQERDEDGTVLRVLYVTQEINEEVKSEQERIAELKQAFQAVDAANQAKTDFLFRMSHDIRTPLNAILGFNHLIRCHAADPQKVQECTEKITSSGNLLLSMLNGILDMTKLESGKTVLCPVAFSMDELLEEIELVIHSQAMEKEQSFAVDTKNVVHARFLGDRGRISRVLFNILGNAVKYTKPGGKILFSVQEEAADEPGKAWLLFRVRDNGIGMKPELTRIVFEEFLRGNEDAVSQIPGTGLGLAIAKSFTESMGGEISVHSEEGVGSEFTVHLPLYVLEGQKKTASETSDEGKNAENILSGLRILVVEDNELNMEVVTEILKLAGAQCIAARSGMQALQKFGEMPEGSLDLVLMDVRMPEMDGYETTRRMRQMERADAQALPIVALTAHAFAEDVENARRAGMNAHLAKPLDLKALRRTAEMLLSDRNDTGSTGKG